MSRQRMINRMERDGYTVTQVINTGIVIAVKGFMRYHGDTVTAVYRKTYEGGW